MKKNFTSSYVKCLRVQFFLVRISPEVYAVYLCIQSEYGKIRTRKTSIFGHFYAVSIMMDNSNLEPSATEIFITKIGSATTRMTQVVTLT